MNKKYGLYCMGTLVNTYEDAIEAHDDAVYAQEESGVPHEAREIDEVTDLNEFKFKLSEEAIAVVSNTVYTAYNRQYSYLYKIRYRQVHQKQCFGFSLNKITVS